MSDQFSDHNSPAQTDEKAVSSKEKRKKETDTPKSLPKSHTSQSFPKPRRNHQSEAKVHLSARLSNEAAKKRLVKEINRVIDEEEKAVLEQSNIKETLLDHNSVSCVLAVLLLITATIFSDEFSYVIEAIVYIIFSISSIVIKHSTARLERVAVFQRARAQLESFVEGKSQQHIAGVCRVYAVLRENEWHFLPENMLVRGDLVLVPISEAVPSYFGRVKAVETDEITHKYLEQYVVTETPALKHLRLAIRLSSAPTSPRFDKYVFVVRRLLCIFHWIALVLMTISFLITIYTSDLRHEPKTIGWNLFGRLPGISMALIIPLAPFALHFLLTTFGNAKILSFVFALQKIPANEKKPSLNSNSSSVDFAEDFDESRKWRRKKARKNAHFTELFFGLLLDKYPSLSFTSRLPTSLGAVTVLVATDKDGILLRPIHQPEQIYFYQQGGGVTLHLRNEGEQLSFVEQNWEKRLPLLKPLGLNMLLHRPSSKGAPTTTLPANHHWKKMYVQLLAEYSRKYTQCMCALSKTIGFDVAVLESFIQHEELHTYAPILKSGPPEAPSYMLSLILKAIDIGTFQMLSKGSIRVVLQHCESFFNGSDIQPLTLRDKEIILKRAFHGTEEGDESYSKQEALQWVAFSYKPISHKHSALFNKALQPNIEASNRLNRKSKHEIESIENKKEIVNEKDPIKTKSGSVELVSFQQKASHVEEDSSTKAESVRSSLEFRHIDENQHNSSSLENARKQSIEKETETMILDVRFTPLEIIERKLSKMSKQKTEQKVAVNDSKRIGPKRTDESETKSEFSALEDVNSKESLIQSKEQRDHIEAQSAAFSLALEVGVESQIGNAVGTALTETSVEMITHSCEDEKKKKTSKDQKSKVSASVLSSKKNVHYAKKKYLHDSKKLSERKRLREKIVHHQVFTGMVALREQPKENVVRFVQELSDGGIRFAFFSNEGQTRSIVFGKRLGLDTDWNCIISLKDPQGGESPHMDGAARLPRGISNIRNHIRDIDNVPLLVSIFSDATPDSTREMIKIMQENGEIVLCVGSCLNMHNEPAYAQADVSFGLQPLPFSLLQPCVDVVDDNTTLISSASFVSKPTTGLFPADLAAISCELLLHSNTPMCDLLSIIEEGRHVLRNTIQAVISAAVLEIIAALIVFLSAIVRIPEVLDFTRLLFYSIVFVFILSITHLEARQKGISKQIMPKNQIQPLIIKRNIIYLLPPIIFNVVFHIILFLVSLNSLWKLSSFRNLFYLDLEKLPPEYHPNIANNRYHDALVYSQNITLFSLVLNVIVLTITMTNPSQNFFANRTYRMVNIRIIIPLVIATVVSFIAISLAVTDSFELFSSIPYYVYVMVGIGVVISIVMHFGLTFWQKKWFEKYQLLLHLQFETKLGMFSPKAVGEGLPNMSPPPLDL